MKRLVFILFVYVTKIVPAEITPTTLKHSIIIVMGSSCSGKSSIAAQLQRLLRTDKASWRVVDFDEVGESLENVVSATQKLLETECNVIIDTNTYEDWVEQTLSLRAIVFKVRIYAPLEILLERDAQRTKKHNRTEERAFWARDFVIKSDKDSKQWKTDIQVSTDTGIQDKKESILICCNQIVSAFFNKGFLC
ncbi:TPA: hypothetical protein DDZ86_00470 [Candidatus Dependentiae bacterium]|nr:hypothetical protein [Candidatus Dependentiae bacterium]